MKRVAWLALPLLFAVDARADDWTTADTVVEAGCMALFLVDWQQTLDRRYVESNPILGSRPSHAAVDGYFLGAMTIQAVVAWLLPSPWRSVFQGVTIGIEGHSVVNNWRLGARLGW